MKTKMYLLLLAVITIICIGVAQGQPGNIKVLLLDTKTKEGIPFANVLLTQNGKQISTGTTDIDGYCFIKNLLPGKYDLKGILTGYRVKVMTEVDVRTDRTTYFSLPMDPGDEQKEEVIIKYNPPVINPYKTQPATIDRKEFQQKSSKRIDQVLTPQGG